MLGARGTSTSSQPRDSRRRRRTGSSESVAVLAPKRFKTAAAPADTADSTAVAGTARAKAFAASAAAVDRSAGHPRVGGLRRAEGGAAVSCTTETAKSENCRSTLSFVKSPMLQSMHRPSPPASPRLVFLPKSPSPGNSSSALNNGPSTMNGPARPALSLQPASPDGVVGRRPPRTAVSASDSGAAAAQGSESTTPRIDLAPASEAISRAPAVKFDVPSTAGLSMGVGPSAPQPSTSTFVPPPKAPAVSSLAARRLNKNKKNLSLAVGPEGGAAVEPDPAPTPLLKPAGLATPSLADRRRRPSLVPLTLEPIKGSPANAAHHLSALTIADPNDERAETRSLPPSPVSLAAYVGVEGEEEEDRTIGRLMMLQQVEEMREQMKGGRGMKRRTSIPRLALNLSAASNNPALSRAHGRDTGGPKTAAIGGAFPGREAPTAGADDPVRLIRRDNRERETASVEDSSDESSPSQASAGTSSRGRASKSSKPEEFPYQNGPREILPGIWLGSEQNARDPTVLRDWGIGYVLNVAKEVACPWDREVIPPDEEVVAAAPPPAKAPRKPDLAKRDSEAKTAKAKYPHRRTKTQAAIQISSSTVGHAGPSGAAAPLSRPAFVRPTVSTPNLQSAFRRGLGSPPQQPTTPIPPVPSFVLAPASDTLVPSPKPIPPSPIRGRPRLGITTDGVKSNSLSSSSRGHGRANSSVAPSSPAVAAASSAVTQVQFRANRATGRPAIDYLWLKWGHDESDLVEAGKFERAFDFLDKARAAKTAQPDANTTGVLVHCQCGVSRSATVIIAYCMREAARALEQGRTEPGLETVNGMHDAYSYVREKSEWIGPNLCLVFQLVAWERTLRGITQDPEEEEEELRRREGDGMVLDDDTSVTGGRDESSAATTEMSEDVTSGEASESTNTSPRSPGYPAGESVSFPTTAGDTDAKMDGAPSARRPHASLRVEVPTIQTTIDGGGPSLASYASAPPTLASEVRKAETPAASPASTAFRAFVFPRGPVPEEADPSSPLVASPLSAIKKSYPSLTVNELAEFGLTRSKTATGFGAQTLEERRMAHRRVFSVEEPVLPPKK